MDQEPLFNRYQIFGIIQGRTEAVKKKVQAIPANTLLNASEHDLVQALVEEFQLHVPTIKNDDIYIAHSGETEVDVSRDFTRGYFGGSGAAYVTGNKTVIAVPFEGDGEFFRVQPQTYTLSPPRGSIGSGEIPLTYVRADQNAEAIKQEYQRTVASIKELSLRCRVRRPSLTVSSQV